MERSRKHTILLTFLVLFLTAEVHAADRGALPRPNQNDNSFDLFILAMSWPYSACYIHQIFGVDKQCNIPNPPRWTIHGLWPSRFGAMGSEYCNRRLRFQRQNLAAIEAQLNAAWMTIDAGRPNHGLWKYEWDKHGTCSGNTQENYFRKTLELAESYNVGGVLAAQNIHPGHLAPVGTYLKALKDFYGAQPFIACARIPDKCRPDLIMEIRLCFNIEFGLIDCRGILSYPTNCNRNKNILYPNGIVPFQLGGK